MDLWDTPFRDLFGRYTYVVKYRHVNIFKTSQTSQGCLCLLGIYSLTILPRTSNIADWDEYELFCYLLHDYVKLLFASTLMWILGKNRAKNEEAKPSLPPLSSSRCITLQYVKYFTAFLNFFLSLIKHMNPEWGQQLLFQLGVSKWKET